MALHFLFLYAIIGFWTVSARSSRSHALHHVHPHKAMSTSLDALVPSTLTWITPSPGATAIAVTTQSQTITSYATIYTVCTSSNAVAVPPYANHSRTLTSSGSSCSTHFIPIVTSICHTTLRGIVQEFVIDACEQQITFSSQYSYKFLEATRSTALVTASSSFLVVTSYYIAPWQELIPGRPAPRNLTLRACSAPSGTEACIDQPRAWTTTTKTSISTSTLTVEISTAISGPAILMLASSTVSVSATALTTIEIQTLFDLVRTSTWFALVPGPTTTPSVPPTVLSTIQYPVTRTETVTLLRVSVSTSSVGWDSTSTVSATAYVTRTSYGSVVVMTMT